MTEPFEPIDTLTGPGETKFNAQTLARVLGEVFPEAVTDGGIDFETLRELVGDEALPPAAERFGLSWPGKAASRRLALLPPTGTLLPRPDESVEWDSTKNIVIEGDNLEVLRLLRRGYAGKVDVIYIDPPYNTGSDLVYHDSRVTPKGEYEVQAGERDDQGRLVKNTDSSGRRHAAWLDMMHPRLWAARDLLKETGIIIAAIDDNEHANLRLLLDQIFGSENFLANVVWQGSGKNDARFTSGGLDYMLIYAANRGVLVGKDVRFKTPKKGYDQVIDAGAKAWEKSKNNAAVATELFREWWRTRPDTEPGLKAYTEIDENGRIFTRDNLASPNPRENLRFDILHPRTGQPVPMHANGWRLSREAMDERIKRGQIIFGADHTTTPRFKRLLSDMDEQAIRPIVTKERAPASDGLARLLGEKVFDYPKDTGVLGTWINAVTGSNRDAVILDFFAGSASTGHAVMELNATDALEDPEVGGRRKYLLVQIDEAIDHAQYETIADVARERLRRAGETIAATHGLNAEFIDLGFRSYRLAESNTRKWNGTLGEQSLEDAIATAVDNLLPGRTTDDLLVEMMLRLGLELTTHVEQREVAGSPLYNLGGGAMFAYFGTGLTVEESKQIAQEIRAWRDEEGPVTETAVVVRDTGFANSAAKLNLAAALNQAGITNLRSI